MMIFHYIVLFYNIIIFLTGLVISIKHPIFHDFTQVLILNPDCFALPSFPFNFIHLDSSGLQFSHSHPDHQLRDSLEQSADVVFQVIHANIQWLARKSNPGRWFLAMLGGYLPFFLDQSYLGEELLGDYSCTKPCFSAVIGQKRKHFTI